MHYRAAFIAFALGVILSFPFALGGAESSPEEWTAHLANDFLRSFNEDFSAGSLDVWMGHWAEDAVRESSRESWKGKAAIRAAYQDILAVWDSPALVHERSRMVLGNRLAWQGFFAGHHKKSGRDVLVPIALFVTFDEAAHVKHARYYIDVQYLSDQVEARVAPR